MIRVVTLKSTGPFADEPIEQHGEREDGGSTAFRPGVQHVSLEDVSDENSGRNLP